MDGEWLWQVRLVLAQAWAEAARRAAADGSAGREPELDALFAALHAHDAVLVNQLDAFEGYVAVAEEHGAEGFPLYRWTKASLADPAKRVRHATSFAVRVGGAEVYPGTAADALEAALRPLVGAGVVERLTRHDTNPANNPQPPPGLRG